MQYLSVVTTSGVGAAGASSLRSLIRPASWVCYPAPSLPYKLQSDFKFRIPHSALHIPYSKLIGSSASLVHVLI